MARKKVTLQWIVNDSTRRATYKKRRKGLMKKASELSTLCDVDACVVTYGEGDSQPEVWPSVAEAARILARFKAMPELDQCKKMMDMEGFLKQRIDKLKEQVHKAQRENHLRETQLLLFEAIVGRRPGLLGLTAEEIASLGWMVESRLQVVRQALERFQGAPPPATMALQQPQQQMPSQAALPMVPYNREVQAAPQFPQGWMMDAMTRTGGDLGALVYGGFGGASTSTGGGQMPQLGNMGPGFVWPDTTGQSFPPM